MNPSERFIFFQVSNASAKCKKITDTAKNHFEKKESLIFFVENEKAALFVDELLWKFPETSFLPHLITDEPTTEPLVITTSKINVNQASFAFNLCPTPLLIEGFQIIYDFEDLSTQSKQNLSGIRLNAYKQGGLILTSLL